MLYVYQVIVEIHVADITITLKRLQLGVTQEVLLNSTVTATTLLIAILVYRILIEEYHDVGLAIYQTPHIGLTMTEVGLESLPCLIYVYVGTRSQGSILQCLVKPTLLDKQTIRRLDGNEYATLRLLCFWLGCWLRWDFNIICLFICRCSFYFNRDNCIIGMLLEPRIELLVWNTLVNTKGIN